MASKQTQGRAPHGDVVDTHDDLWEQLHRMTGAAQLILARHSERMRKDSGYREGVESLVDWFASRHGRVGRAARAVADGHALLIKLT